MALSMEPKASIHYADGNGNAFTAGIIALKPTQPLVVFSYDPITREESSSGMYDGGEPVDDVLITLDKGGDAALGFYEAIRRAIVAVVETHDHKDVVARREMGTGAVLACPLSSDQFEGGQDEANENEDEAHFPCFLGRNSDTKREVEALWASLLHLGRLASTQAAKKPKPPAKKIGALLHSGA